MSAKITTDSQERKDTPVFSGFMAYFPLAMAEVARLSKEGNDKHNPGEPLHWARGKSEDHADCIVRHQLEVGVVDTDKSPNLIQRFRVGRTPTIMFFK